MNRFIQYLLIFASVANAQVLVSTYQAKKETALVAAAEKITIQQPATSPVSVQFDTVDVYCSVACVVTFSWNGTAATATTLTPIALLGSPTGSAKAFSSSDVGAGNTGKSFNIGAGGTFSFDVSKFYFPRGGGTQNNFSVGTDSITGTVRIQFQWREL